jgi:hypothetical protein
MNRQYNEDEMSNNRDEMDGEERFNCPETGAHFEFLEMCRRLKRLQKKRTIVDKAIDDELEKIKMAQIRKEVLIKEAQVKIEAVPERGGSSTY